MNYPSNTIVQVAYVVNDMEAALKQWIDLKMAGPFYMIDKLEMDNPIYRSKTGDVDATIALAYSGNMCIELIKQNCNSPSVYKELLGSKGAGFHHWGIFPKNYEQALTEYQNKGFDLAFEASVGGARFAYLDTVAKLGGMTELFEPSPQIKEVFSFVEQESRDWDGKNPIRQLG